MISDVRERLLFIIDDMCGCVPSFGELVAKTRKSKDQTQQSLSLRLNRGPTWISDVENDRGPRSITLKDVEDLATALNCHPIEKARLVDAYICQCLRQIGE
jgi:transcriptional regulator with XRE-family HTH domain